MLQVTTECWSWEGQRNRAQVQLTGIVLSALIIHLAMAEIVHFVGTVIGRYSD